MRNGLAEYTQLRPERQHPSMHACARAQTFVLGNGAHSCGHWTLNCRDGRQSGFMHEIIVRALDEMQLLGLQIEN